MSIKWCYHQSRARMSINFKNALGTYESALRLRTQRAEVLSSNLANADTPNFKARDFNFQQALKAELDGQASPKSMTTTQSNHLLGAEGARGFSLQYRTPTQPSIDGNTVDEHIEHAEFMRNSLEFQTAFTFLNSRFKGLISALKGE